MEWKFLSRWVSEQVRKKGDSSYSPQSDRPRRCPRKLRRQWLEEGMLLNLSETAISEANYLFSSEGTNWWHYGGKNHLTEWRNHEDGNRFVSQLHREGDTNHVLTNRSDEVAMTSRWRTTKDKKTSCRANGPVDMWLSCDFEHLGAVLTFAWPVVRSSSEVTRSAKNGCPELRSVGLLVKETALHAKFEESW